MNDRDWLAEAQMLSHAAPRSFLFLCVANSARSQLAEGVARMLAPKGVRVASAGSEPTSVRPEAVAVLAELGIDASGHSSTDVLSIDPATVDAVITLCADEVCPVILSDSIRVHWGLPDPAAIVGDDSERLAAFRDVRDELRRRLAVVFR